MSPEMPANAAFERKGLPANSVMISIFGFWLFYAFIVTVRASLVDLPSQNELAIRRIAVILAGIFVTFLIWQVMRMFDHRRLSLRVTVAMVICVPASLLFALVNHFVFNIYDQGSMIDIEAMRREAGVLTDAWLEIVEIAITRYFFLIAWTALYLALSYAHDALWAERRAATLERAAQLSELRALRYQINPHFLFNTLNSLSALVMRGSRDEAETMIMNLATFYRSSLSGDPSDDALLSDEIEGQRLYLAIEQVRFADRLKLEIDLPAELSSAAVPGLILQPLIENAIKHGVARTAQPVKISIIVSSQDGLLTLSVSDDAPHSNGEEGNGIGLVNVQERLTARFGSAAKMESASLPGRGFRATLLMPLVIRD